MARRPSARAQLRAYREKRDFAVTDEPEGGRADAAGALRFVIQKHAASHLHFDLRLELDGVMKSWAVPKGPSLDPSVKRLAMQVEDHPIEYNSFEGTIPEGEYGGGTVMLWDVGTYEPEEPGDDPVAALRRGYGTGDLKLVFHGARMQGGWVLVRMNRPGKPQWLLIKHRDEFARDDVDLVAETETSVATGRTMAEIAGDDGAVWHSNRDGGDAQGRDEGAASGTARGKARKAASARSQKALADAAGWLAPMLATLDDTVPSGDDWTFEPKYDGIRVIAIATREGAALMTRNGNDKATQFPEVAEAVRALAEQHGAPLVLDGEIVAVVDGEIARFQALQARMHVTSGTAIARHVDDTPVSFVVFDLLLDGDAALLPEPWTARRERLALVMEEVDDPRLQLAESDRGDGARMLARARAAGWEGIIAKRVSAPYRPGVRSRDWLKLKVEHRQELVVGGWTEPRNSRERIGAVLLGYYDGDDFIYAGHTGGGFTREALHDMDERLRPLERRTPPFTTRPRTNERPHWTQPRVVVEVKFSEWTNEGKLRQPIFLGVRDDKDPRDVVRERVADPAAAPAPARGRATRRSAGTAAARKKAAAKKKSPAARAARAPAAEPDDDVGAQLEAIEREGGDGTLQLPGGATLSVSSLGKKFYTRPTFTKGALMRYYASVAPVLLPALADRPLVMKRSPDGIDGETFFQQRPPTGFPAAARVEDVPTEDGAQPRVIGGDLATLLALVQLGVISMDPWHSRVGSLDAPDYAFLDLDPGDKAPFSRVVETALAVREALTELGLRGIPRTSGASGMHIAVPLPAGLSYDVAVLLSQLVATRVAEAHPRIATVERAVKKRGAGQVYVDYLQNVRGKSIASVYSARARRGATVATPLAWDEVTPALDPRAFTIETVPARIAEVGDLWGPAMRRPNGIATIRRIAGGT